MPQRLSDIGWNFDTGEESAGISAYFPAHRAPRAVRARAINSSTRGKIRATITSTPAAFGCRPSRLIQFRIGGHTVKKEWIKDDRVSRGKRRIDRVEIAVRNRRPCCAAPASRRARRQCDGPQACAGLYRARSWSLFGSSPRNASFAPSSRMTASVPSGTDQSRRPSPPAAVSPDTPASMIVTAMSLALSAAVSLAGNAASAGNPRPALRESPSTTILTGRSAVCPPVSVASAQNNVGQRPRPQGAGPGRGYSHMSGVAKNESQMRSHDE